MKKEERVMPEPDRYAVCAPADFPILEFYRGVFDSCFILLHPFIKPTKIPTARFRPKSYPSKEELNQGSEKVTWGSVLKSSGLDDLSQIDIGLRTGISGLRKEFGNQHFNSIISEIEESEGIIRPSEGRISEMLEDSILSSLQRLNYHWVWIGDEFCSERKLHWIDDLKNTDFMPCHGSIFTPDHRVLITTDWDSHFSLLCADQKLLEAFLATDDYEGFWCDEETEIYWSIRNKNIHSGPRG